MLRFVPFADLPPSPEANAANDPRPGAAQVDRIKMLIATEKYDRALEDCAELIEKALQGSQYLQTYVLVPQSGVNGSGITSFAHLLLFPSSLRALAATIGCSLSRSSLQAT